MKGEWQYLLDHGANPLRQDDCGYIALHLTIVCRYSSNVSDRIETARLLLEASPHSINLPSGMVENSPLLLAIKWGDVEMVEFLLEQGANVLQGDACGCTPLEEARLQRSPRMVSLIERHIQETRTTKRAKTETDKNVSS